MKIDSLSSYRGGANALREAGIAARAAGIALALLLVVLSGFDTAVAAAGSAQRDNIATGAKSAPAALVMIEEPGCPYCARWHREVGVGYPNSSEGRFAPLTIIDISDPERRAFKRVTYTPTFIVVAKGREVGRITGYPGADFFWSMLGDILVKVGYRPDAEPELPSASPTAAR